MDHDDVIRLEFEDGEIVGGDGFHELDWVIFISEIL